MNENEGQQRARVEDADRVDDSKGPTEKLRDQAKPEADRLVRGTETPGAQDPDSVEIKEESNPNTE